MKKLVSFLLAITFVLAIAGCAKTDNDGPVDVQNGGSTAAPDVTDNSSNRTDGSDNSTTSKDVQIPASDVVISIEDAVGKTVENQQLVVKVIDTAMVSRLQASTMSGRTIRTALSPRKQHSISTALSRICRPTLQPSARQI